MKGLVRAVLTVALTMLLSLTLIHAPGAAAASASAGKDATSASLQKKQKTDLDSLTAGISRHLVKEGEQYRFDVHSARAADESALVIQAGQNFNAMARDAARTTPPVGSDGEPMATTQLSIPVWGNWCGPGHSGPGAPIDTLDTLCMRHDKCYAARGYFDCACDAQLKAEIDRYASRMGTRERAMAAAVKMAFSVGICNPF
ncbi:hypothetical protein HMPREF2863_08975 [Micrococcus sp. HMSC067E09]|uniref:phospholipase A2 family protein n=1 Tax=Micrococcus sp. HMSC067E09 TaxID=1739367 RepID=UPI0008A38597|nr:phospholipase A2 family protein [Micrococcus sp. HMSC067E09]OFR89537.1 hypothetical protein HMPREF2863_08975 [Micrococcus sp. HMSC067E09]